MNALVRCEAWGWFAFSIYEWIAALGMVAEPQEHSPDALLVAVALAVLSGVLALLARIPEGYEP